MHPGPRTPTAAGQGDLDQSSPCHPLLVQGRWWAPWQGPPGGLRAGQSPQSRAARTTSPPGEGLPGWIRQAEARTHSQTPLLGLTSIFKLFLMGLGTSERMPHRPGPQRQVRAASGWGECWRGCEAWVGEVTPYRGGRGERQMPRGRRRWGCPGPCPSTDTREWLATHPLPVLAASPRMGPSPP